MENEDNTTPKPAGTSASMIVGSTVQHFVEDFITQAEVGLSKRGYVSCPQSQSHVAIELNATEEKEVGGGLKVHVLSLGGKKVDSNVQKMTIFARKRDADVEDAQKRAEIAEANARHADAKAAQELVEGTRMPLGIIKKG